MAEKHNIEYKSVWKDKWLAWICGYANADGGLLYIGITDEGETVGLLNPKKLMEDIPNKIADKLRIYPSVRLLGQDDMQYIEIEVRPSEEAITLDGILYKRVGATNQIIKGSALRDFYYQKLGSTWDARIVPGVEINEIDPEAVKYFLDKGINKGRLPKESIYDSPEKVLRNLKVMTADGQITMAAILLFGKDPQQYCLNSRIKIGRFGKTQSALMTQDLIDGDLIRMTDKILNILDAKYLIRPIHYEGLQRIEPLEIPEEALREIINNAIIHKAYTGSDSQLRVFDDRITLWNEGTLPEGYSPESLFGPHDSKPRNRLIANAFYMAGFIEAWGRGFEIIKKEFTKAGLEVPIIEEEFGGVRVLIKREIFNAIQNGGKIDDRTGKIVNAHNDNDVTKKLTERQLFIYELLQIDDTKNVTKKEITIKQLSTKIGKDVRTIKRDMRTLQELGLIKHVGPANGGYWIRIK